MDPTNLNISAHVPVLSEEFVFYCQTVSLALAEGFSLFGCFSNIVNMVVFSKQGFKDPINVSLFGMSLSDFGASFFMIWIHIFYYPKFVELDSLPFYPKEVGYIIVAWPRILLVKVTTVLTALVVFERCLCVVMPIKIKTIITTKRVKIFVVCAFVFITASIIPAWYANRLDWKFSPALNRSLYGIVFTQAAHDIESVLFFAHSLGFSMFAFIFISVCTVILYINLRRKAVWRRAATAVSQTTTTTNSKDEMSSKDTKVAKTVVILSAMFISCFIPYNMMALGMAVDKEMSVRGKKYEVGLTLGAVASVTESINSATNIFIYYFNSSKYRTTLRKLFGFKE